MSGGHWGRSGRARAMVAAINVVEGSVGYMELPTGPRSHVTPWASG